MMITSKTTLTAALLCATPLACAQIEYLQQDRFVEIHATLPGGDDGMLSSSSELGAFDETLNEWLGNTQGSAWAYAAQTSSLRADAMSATGAADGEPGPPVGTSFGLGRTGFSINFRLTEAVEYTLDLSVFSEFASYSFAGPSLDVVRGFDFAFNDPGVHLSGTLGPGDYAFDFKLESGAEAAGLGSNFDFSFVVVPSPGAVSALALGALACARRRR
jgi:hypothetical protein